MDRYLSSLNAWIPVVGTLLGVILGGVVGYVVQWVERRKELRSVVQALLWELQDAYLRLTARPAILASSIPSMETLLTRGLLASCPRSVRGRVLAARSIVQVHRLAFEDHKGAREFFDPSTSAADLKTLTQIAEQALPIVLAAIEAVSGFLGRHAISRTDPIAAPGAR